MRKIPIPDEDRRKATRLFDGGGAETSEKAESGERAVKADSKKAFAKPAENKKTCSVGYLKTSRAGYAEDGYDGDFADGNDDLIKKSKKRSARDYALTLVSSHTYTERSLFQKMAGKKLYTESEITEAVEFVKGFGYINDKRLAENALASLAERGYGRQKICRYLASKGIDEEIIETLPFSEIDFAFYCKRLLDKQKGKPYEKIMRTLLNAGYTYDEINEARKQSGKE